MKAKVKATGEEITIDGSVMSIFDIKGSCYYLSELTFIKNEIDWEQRRYEIAKDIMAAYTGNGDYPFNNGEEALAKWSVMAANALIKELKGGKK